MVLKQLCGHPMPLPVPIRCTNIDGHQNPHYVMLKMADTDGGIRDIQIAWSIGLSEEEAKKFPKILGVPLAPYDVETADLWEN